MADPTTDFLKDYQALAQQSWDAWMRQWQQAGGVVAPTAFSVPSSPAGDLLARSAAGLKGFFDWMQGAASVPAAAAPDWRQQLQQWFGAGAQPFAQAFAGLDQSGAHGFAQQWQQWMQAAQQSGAADLRAFAPMAPLGYTREQQLRQQAMSKAILEYLETAARHQALIQRVNAQGVELMQQKLAQRSERGQPVESLKALYDLWVDAVEEAYAEIALSDEFREAYGAMINAQMRVRHLQQQETERVCRELGMPTRGELASVGQRLQELRREMAELKRRQKERPAPVVEMGASKPPSKRASAGKSAAKPAVAVTKSRSRSNVRAKAQTRK